MKINTVLFLLFLCLLAGSGYAQGVIEFETETHDFGEVEEGEQAAYEFTFKNTGNAPIVLSGVRASCGCTTPYWTRDPVAPGETGSIKASYNSKGRPGSFHKTITITSNAKPPRKMVYIKGTVVKKKKVYTAEEKRLSPKLMLPKTEVRLGTIERGQSATARVEIRNNGIKDLEISSVSSPCRCVQFSTSKASLPKGQQATLYLTYTPRGLGNQSETVTIESNDIVGGKQKVVLKANVVESVSKKSIMENDKNNPFR